MHWFFPGAFFWPGLFFFGFFRILLFVLLIALVVRLVSHGHRRADYAYGPGYHRRGHVNGPSDFDPARATAWRYAAGQIDRAEFDRIMSALGSSTTPPAPPVAPVA